MIKKVFVTVLVCILILPSFAVRAESFNSYDLYKDAFPPVRDQRGYADCWSYAATGAVEHSMAVKDNGDFSTEDALFSEWHMAAAMNTAEDGYFRKYTRSHEAGGNRESAVAYLARSFASGPVLYKAFNENEYNMYLADRSRYKLFTLKKKLATLTSAQFLTDKNEGSSYAEYDVSSGKVIYGKNEEVIDKIKNAVKEYGAVAVSYYAYEEKNYYNAENAAYCVPWEDYIDKKTPDGNHVTFTDTGYSFEKVSNHTVLIVGWDDDYSYENFKETPVSFDGERYIKEKGAWIVKNSWGTDFGMDGFEYISYMDPTICRFATVYDMEHTQSCKAVTHTQKGLMGSVRFPDTGYGVCALNRFEAHGLINAVGIYVCDTSPSVQILIDTSPEEEPKRFSKAQFEKNREILTDIETGEEAVCLRFEEKGYYMLYLKESIYVDGKFDVYVKYNVDEKSDVILPAGNNIGTNEEYVPSVTYWAYITGKDNVHQWKEIDANWCVNVFTTEADFERVKTAVGENTAMLKLHRYNEAENCRVMALFCNGDEVVEKKSYFPEFDEYGYWEVSEKVEGVTSVKAFAWQKGLPRYFLKG